MSATSVVQVGIGVLIMRNHKVLVGKRIGSHGADTWQLAGGESLEETGLVLNPSTAKIVTANNNIMSSINKHYVTVFVSAKVTGSSEAKIMEPLKCEQWQWIDHAQLLDDKGPYRPLFSPLAKLVAEHDLTSLFAESG
ncbi:Nudix hydrolase 15, mitochondrial [Mortierella sp. GBA30]|nr:Nudix hydrolase 15, mitochondrial [Mortierella sp. GBA30]